MNTHLVITTSAGEMYYETAYLFASLVSIIIFLAIGIYRKYRLHNWLLIGLCGMVMMTIGMRIATFSLEDWQVFFTDVNGVYSTGKTSLGALAGFMIGVGLTQKILKTQYPVLDIYAFILPVVLIIQRTGCLLAGCCFGVPTEAAIGIAYADHYPVTQYHIMSGLAESGSTSSLPLHPVPMYLMVWAVISLILVYKFRKRFQSNGSLFLFSIVIMGAGRWFIEFLRDPVTNHQLGEIWMGLKMVQWALVIMIAVGITLLILREKNRPGAIVVGTSISLLPHYWVTPSIAIIAVLFAGIMGRTDILNIGIFLAFYTVVLAKAMLRNKGSSAFRWSPLFLVFISFLFMGQTDTLDNTPQRLQREHPLRAEVISTSKTHTLALARGNIVGEKGLYQGSGCDATRIGTMEHEAQLSGGYNYEFSKLYDNGNRTILGTGVTFSSFIKRTYGLQDNQKSESRKMDWGMMGYFGKDWKTFGYRLGLWGGDMHFYSKDGYDYHIEEFSVMPIIHLRAGNLNSFYVIGSLADDYAYGYYRYLAKASVGGALRMGDSYARLEAGINQNNHIIIDAEFPLTNRWLLNPSIVFTGDTPTLGVGVRYRVVNE